MIEAHEFSAYSVEEALVESEWRLGWKVVLAATAGCCAGVFHLGGIMTLAKPLTREFGWSRAEVMMSLLICTVVMLFLGPIVGGLIDRYGPRRVALSGMPFYVLLISAVGFTGPEIWTWYLAWGIAACATSLTAPVVWTIGVTAHFTKSQGKAVGVTLSAGGIATALSLAYAVYQYLGWRAVFPVLSLASFVVAYPLVWLFFHDAKSGSTRPTLTVSDRMPAADPPGLRFADAAWTTRFWRLTLSMFVAGAAMNGLINHLPSMLTDEGVPAAKAAALAALVGPCSIAGRVITGFLFDLAYAPLVGAIAIALPIVSCIILSQYLGAYEALIPAIALIGIVASAEVQASAYLIPRYFGYRSYGRIFGFVFGVAILGMGTGPVVGGLIFDRTGSYDAMILIIVAALGGSALLVGTLGRYPKSWV